MNYKKIYNDFITDRRLKENSIDGYFEKHHIIPRSLGGDNSKKNLIKLTPEDHYFAHLLLAKIHGGKMWKAIFLLSNRVSNMTSQRYMYGAAKRKFSASGNNNYNHTVFNWYNLDNGQQEKLTIYQMHKKHGMNRAHWTSVVTGERNTLAGWTLYERKESHKRRYKGKVFDFVNRDGRRFTGTQKDFCDKFNISYASGTRICRYQSVTKCGWRLNGVKDRKHFFTKEGKPAKKDRGKIFVLQKDGKTISGNRNYLADFFKTNPNNISAAMNIAEQGKTKGYKGYVLIGVKNDKV